MLTVAESEGIPPMPGDRLAMLWFNVRALARLALDAGVSSEMVAYLLSASHSQRRAVAADLGLTDDQMAAADRAVADHARAATALYRARPEGAES